MLLRMYTRWAEKHGYKVSSGGDDGDGVRNSSRATVQIARAETPMAGLKTENGVHRAVPSRPSIRMRAHTSFASVKPIRFIDDRIVVE